MPKSFRSLPSSALAIVLFVSALLFSQTGDGGYSQSLAYGNKTLIPFQSYRIALTENTPLRLGLRSGRYVTRIGGVTFESEALPASGLDISSFGISYNPSNWDGQRFSVSINGERVIAPEYDWQLIPVVQ